MRLSGGSSLKQPPRPDPPVVLNFVDATGSSPSSLRSQVTGLRRCGWAMMLRRPLLSATGIGSTYARIAGKNSRLAKLLIPYLRVPEASRLSGADSSGDDMKLWRTELSASTAHLGTATISRAQTSCDLREAHFNDATRISGNHQTLFLAYW